MPTCIVPGCISGYTSNSEKLHFFTIPKDAESEKLWKVATKRTDSFVKAGKAVCEKHFRKDEILWKREMLNSDGQVLGVTHYKIPRLKKGCIPSQFSWVECIEPLELQDQNRLLQQEVNISHEISVVARVPFKEKGDKSDSEENVLLAEEMIYEDQNLSSLESRVITVEKIEPPTEMESAMPSTLSFTELLAADLHIPSGWMKQITDCGHTKLIFFFTNECRKIDEMYQTSILKDITLKDDMSIQIRVLGVQLNLSHFNLPHCITDIEQLQNLLLTIHRLSVCHGCTAPPLKPEMEQLNCSTLRKDVSGTWRHAECPLLLFDRKVCESCKRANNTLSKNLRRYIQGKVKTRKNAIIDLKEQKRLLSRSQSRYRSAVRSKRRARDKIKCLKKEVMEIRQKMARCTSQDLERHIDNGSIPQNQLHVLNQIIEAAKHTNSKGRNYSEQWMLLCMLLHMRSPAGYEFLRSNEILPLPCMRTVRRYLSNIKTSCGFDPEFLEVLKVALNKKDRSQRHGILLLDEISVRESVSVDTKNLTYKGLIDFGNDGCKSSNFSEKANHALVLMFQPLNDVYSQPIAVFASRGPVKGEVLAQLIVKAVILLENIGAKIHAVVGDGASTNRKFWSEVGVSGKKGDLRNYFEHPVVQGRKIYVFSDTPHLIKTIRNRLYNNGVLQMDPSGSLIKWDYIKLLHEKDRENAGPGQALVCPKLSSNHVILNNSSKMRVRLATQVFSKSVAGGLRFFEKYSPEFRGCEATASFCEWMNDMFDALNRKDPIDGVEPGNIDYQKIQESLRKLDAWEEHVEGGKLSKELFLTKQTGEGLRVTLQSTLDLVEYLTQHCGYLYVLTGRVNQDPLETFFGTVRQAGGSDDHPSTPTFLNIYKILSLYSVLKPPTTGNCSITIQKPTEPLVTLADLKTIYNNPDASSESLNSIKKQLQRIVQHEEWNFENVSEHDYSMPEVASCVMYCLTADLSKRICNTVKCLQCKDALLKSDVNGLILPEAVLSNWQRRDGLVHPNTSLYRFISFLENSFQKHCQSTNIFEDILEDVYNYRGLTFPCIHHAPDILYQIIQYFITKRMQQYCTRVNAEQKKNNQLNKKRSKFCIT